MNPIPALNYETRRLKFDPVVFFVCIVGLALVAALLLFNDITHFQTFTRQIGFEWRRRFFHNDWETIRPASAGDFSPWYMYGLTQSRFGVIGFGLGFCAGIMCEGVLPRIRVLRISLAFVPMCIGMIAIMIESIGPLIWRVGWSAPITAPLIGCQTLGMVGGLLLGRRVWARLQRASAKLLSNHAPA